jgi:hypothetical protein
MLKSGESEMLDALENLLDDESLALHFAEIMTKRKLSEKVRAPYLSLVCKRLQAGGRFSTLTSTVLK